MRLYNKISKILFPRPKSTHNSCVDLGLRGQYSINDDGSVDVDNDVFLVSIKMEKLPLRFGNVAGSFFCNSCGLTSLDGAPKSVGINFDCRNNELSSFEGGPKSVGNVLLCAGNNLTSFKGFPEYIGGISNVSFMDCYNNPIHEIYYLHACRDFIEMINEYDVIRGSYVVEHRLRQALEDSNCKIIPKEFNFKHYQLV